MDISTIMPRELAGLCGNGNEIELIDVRTPTEFRHVHAELARNVPLSKLDPAVFMLGRQRIG